MTSSEHPRALTASDQAAALTAAAMLLCIEELKRRVVELEAENHRLREQSEHDPLTGLLNRRGFDGVLDRAILHRRRYGGALAVLYVDLDGMKALNDTYGHAAGDDGLAAVGAVLRATLRGTDFAARLGGDEFAVVLPSTGAGGAIQVAERIRVAIRELRLPCGGRLTASIGVTTTERAPRACTKDALLARADEALYAAKNLGRDRVELELFGTELRSPQERADRLPHLERRAEVLARCIGRASR
ncbi:GGDEF domain-containing protein [Myxococcota bacterium]|nr:GGDEF domain-containing protein [Myxococcota bacterium]